MIPRFSLPERIAERLREDIHQGRWSGHLPGVQGLTAELDVAPFTVRRALRQLQSEGLLADSGLGRSRSISATGNSGTLRRPLRVAILGHDARLADCPQSSLVLIDNRVIGPGHRGNTGWIAVE
jgi:DNA-binding FadR family transcriptional regulator